MHPESWDEYRQAGSLANKDLACREPIPNGVDHSVRELFVRNLDGMFLLM